MRTGKITVMDAPAAMLQKHIIRVPMKRPSRANLSNFSLRLVQPVRSPISMTLILICHLRPQFMRTRPTTTIWLKIVWPKMGKSPYPLFARKILSDPCNLGSPFCSTIIVKLWKPQPAWSSGCCPSTSTPPIRLVLS